MSFGKVGDGKQATSVNGDIGGVGLGAKPAATHVVQLEVLLVRPDQPDAQLAHIVRIELPSEHQLCIRVHWSVTGVYERLSEVFGERV